MTLSPSERATLRHKLLDAVDLQGHEAIDERFCIPIFSGYAPMLRWAHSWNLELHVVTYPGVNRFVGNLSLPIRWYMFSRPEVDNLVLIEGEDDEL